MSTCFGIEVDASHCRVARLTGDQATVADKALGYAGGLDALAAAVVEMLGAARTSAEIVVALPSGWSEGDAQARALLAALDRAGIRVQSLAPGAVAAAVYQAYRNTLRGPILIVVVGEQQAEARLLEIASDKKMRTTHIASLKNAERATSAEWRAALGDLVRKTLATVDGAASLALTGCNATINLVRHEVAQAAGLPPFELEMNAAGQRAVLHQIAIGAALIAAARPAWKPQLGYDIAVAARAADGQVRRYVIARSDEPVPFAKARFATRDSGAPYFLVERQGVGLTQLLVLAPSDPNNVIDSYEIKFDLPAEALGHRVDFSLDVSDAGSFELAIEPTGLSGGRRPIFTHRLPVAPA